MKPVAILPRWPTLAAVFLLALLSLSACGSSEPLPTSWPGVTMRDDVAYIAFNRYVHAVNLRTQTAAPWKFEATGDPPLFGAAPHDTFYGEPLYLAAGSFGDGQPVKDMLIVGGYSLGRIYAVDPTSGAEMWHAAPPTSELLPGSPLPLKRANGSIISGASVGGGLIYSALNNGTLVAINPGNGQIRWTYHTPDQSGFWGTPAYQNGLIYAASLGHTLYVLDATNGTQRGAYDAGAPLAGSVTLVGDTALFGTFNNHVVAVSADANLTRRWETTVDEWVWGAPQVLSNTVYVATLGGTVYALDLATGDEQWHKALDNKPQVRAPVLVTDKALYIVDRAGFLHALDRATGVVLWTGVRAEADIQLLTQPSLWDKNRLVIALTGVSHPILQLHSTADGSLIWPFKP